MADSLNHKDCQPVPVDVKEVLEKGFLAKLYFPHDEKIFYFVRSEGSGREVIEEIDWLFYE